LSEAALYAPVKRFLEARGWEVKGEVGGCDVVAVQAGDPPRVAVAELKLGLSFDLVLQGVDRLRCADEVWLAVPATRRGRDRDARARRLCRLLGFGLLALHPRDVEVLAEPAPYQPRRDLRRRKRILAEHAARAGDPSPGGTGGQKIMTAYRQEALLCATKLRDGPLRPRDLRPEAPRAAAILHRNVYGWFHRVERGLYGLTPSGEEALIHWPPTPSCPGSDPRHRVKASSS